MNLRDCLVRHGIVSSRAVCRLSIACQLFFRNLLHTCDGAGRFVADADELRIALYQHALDRVTRLHVSRWMTECHQAELVRLYTGPDGRGYGEVLKYGQRDSKRRVIHPAREADQLDFHGAARPPDPPSELNRRGIECERADPREEIGYTPRGSGTHTHESVKAPKPTLATELARLIAAHPEIDIPKEIELATRYVRRARGEGAHLTLHYFEKSWLPRSGGLRLAVPSPTQKIPAEPEYWREMLNEEFPNSSYARGGADEGMGWNALPRHARDLCLEKLPAWLRSTGRNAA